MESQDIPMFSWQGGPHLSPAAQKPNLNSSVDEIDEFHNETPYEDRNSEVSEQEELKFEPEKKPSSDNLKQNNSTQDYYPTPLIIIEDDPLAEKVKLLTAEIELLIAKEVDSDKQLSAMRQALKEITEEHKRLKENFRNKLIDEIQPYIEKINALEKQIKNVGYELDLFNLTLKRSMRLKNR